MAASLIQYVVIRSDLKTVLQWPVGALMAQVKLKINYFKITHVKCKFTL